MTLKRMDNVGIVVESLDDAIAFFAELGVILQGRAMIEGEWEAYRLCYIRGPEGILIGLAQELS